MRWNTPCRNHALSLPSGCFLRTDAIGIPSHHGEPVPVRQLGGAVGMMKDNRKISLGI